MSIYMIYMQKTLSVNKKNTQANLSLLNGSTAFSTSQYLPQHGCFVRLFVPTLCEEKQQENKEQATVTPTTLDRLSMVPAIPKNFVTNAEVEAFIQLQTPYDRLRAMYTRSPVGEFSPELDAVYSLSRNCAFLIFLGMSVVGSRAAREAHISKAKHMKFATRFQALRAYHDAVFFGGLRFGILWAFKTGFFTASFLLVSQSIAVYRNKTSVLEYIAGGGLTCALLRFGVGPRGMLAGGAIGCGIGLVAGLGFYALFNVMGETQDKRHFNQVRDRLNELRQLDMLTSTPRTEPAVAAAAVNTV